MRNANLWLALFMFFSVNVYAEQIPNIGDLDRAQGEAMLGKAQASAAQARAEAAKFANEEGLPNIWSIVAVDTRKGSRTVATLIYKNGSRFEVSEGDMIPGGYRVVAIYVNQNQVELAKGKEHQRLGFAGKMTR